MTTGQEMCGGDAFCELQGESNIAQNLDLLCKKCLIY